MTKYVVLLLLYLHEKSIYKIQNLKDIGQMHKAH